MSPRAFLRHILPRSDRFRHLCETYANFVRDQGCFDIELNGELRMLKAILPKANTLFDIGANVGNYTRAALTCNPNLEVHCFEPDPSVYHHLKQASFPQGANITLHHQGMGDHVGTADFYTAGGKSELGSLHRRVDLPEEIPQSKIDIPINTVDHFMQSSGIHHVDFVKVDVEGGEYDVLSGANTSLRNAAISYVQIEYGGTYIGTGRLLKDIFELAADHQYQMFQIGAKGLRPIKRYATSLENFVAKYFLLASPGTTPPGII